MSWSKMRSGRKNTGGGRRLAGLVVIAGLAIAGCWGYGRLSADHSGRRPATADAHKPTPAISRPVPMRINHAPDKPALLLEIKPLFSRVPGGEAMAKGKFHAAAKELESYLAAPEADYADEARFHLARCYQQTAQRDRAAALYREIIELHPQSAYGGGALVALAKAAEIAGNSDERDRFLLEAFTKFRRTDGGAAAALRLADRWFEKFAIRQEVKAHWEEIRDAYAVALNGVTDEAQRGRIVERLTKLNEHLIFGKGVKSSGIVVYRVQPGDALAKIARRHRVSVGSIMRLNDLRSSALIRIGQRLKILRGEAAIRVDKTHLRLTLYIGRRYFKEYPVGIGSEQSTPEGTFKITTKVKDPTWYPAGGTPLPPGDPRNILGSRWMGFERTGAGAGIGIHGTTRPESVPGRESAGCIRMLNAHVEELYDWAKRGTVVTIVE